MVGGTTLGYWLTGSAKIETAPISTMMMAMTLARTGRSMKNFEITRLALWLGGSGLGLRLHLLAGDRALQAGDDDLIVGRKTRRNNAHAVIGDGPERHALLLHDPTLADGQDIGP